MDTRLLKKFLSDEKRFYRSDEPQVGDIALWEGHTGIVTKLGENGTFSVTHASNPRKPSGEQPKPISADAYNCGMLIGFFRPIDEFIPDNKVYRGKDLDEVIIIGLAIPKTINVRIINNLPIIDPEKIKIR